MKKTLVSTVVAAAVLWLTAASPVSAEIGVKVRKIEGQVTPLAPITAGGRTLERVKFTPDPGAEMLGIPGNMYDNILTIFGGLATFGSPTFTGFTYLAWAGSTVNMGDDLHGILPGVITQLNYQYFQVGAGPPQTHFVKLYAMVPPSVTHGTTIITIDKGPTLSIIPVPVSGASGAHTVTVTNLSIAVTSAAWIKFEDTDPAGVTTFWLYGGIPGLGTSHLGVVYDPKAVGPEGTDYNTWIPGSFMTAVIGITFAPANLAVALSTGGGPAVPTISEWGMIALTLLLFTVATIVIRGRRVAMRNAASCA